MAHPRWSTSLDRRLSLAIASLLAVGLATFGALAYLVTRRATIDAAAARLSISANHLAQLFGTGAKARWLLLENLARHPKVIAALREPPGRIDLTKQLGSLGVDTGQIVAIELRDASGVPIAALNRRSPGGIPEPSTGGVGPLRARGDSVFSEITAPVTRGGATLGYLAIVSLVRTNDRVFRAFSSLVGDQDARVVLGNADGSVWSDMTPRMARPIASVTSKRWTVGSREYLGALAPLAGTPLVVGIETPMDHILAPVWTLMARFAGIAALLIVSGVLVARKLGRAVSRPVADLTTATEAIAAGVPWEHALPIRANDEIGRLARAFSAMVASVKRARENLEQQVTERTAELENALQKLETTQGELVRKERLAILGQMSSGVGHELRNPLGVMTNAVYYLTATLQPAPPKVQEYLDILGKQIRTSEKIVSDLLDFAKVRPPQLGRVSLMTFLDEELKRVSIPNDIRVVREHLGSAPPVALADEVQLGQVMLNVLTNAVQAMETDGGTLTIRVVETGSTVRIEIQDSGPGISPDSLERIFEPLYTTKPRGIGLGLSVSRGLARANGGDLSATSVVGQGATFVLEIPAAHPEPSTAGVSAAVLAS